MTFLELQRKIVQTRKARRGVSNRIDYFSGDINEEFYNIVYKRALWAANEVIKHYEDKGQFASNDKLKIVWK